MSLVRDAELEVVLSGDDAAFAALVDAYAPTMLRVALLYVPDRAVAEEVVQETWIAVLRSIRAFEGRSSFKTWLLTILTNEARRRARREARSAPFSSLAAEEAAELERPDADRFFGADHPRWPHTWSTAVSSWEAIPDERLVATETHDRVADVVAKLPEVQRLVFTLRDVEGFSADEVCNVLGLSDSNQRVLLHRARLKVRRALERYFG